MATQAITASRAIPLLLSALVALVFAGTAHASTPMLWLGDDVGPPADTDWEPAEETERILRDLLSGDRTVRHVVGRRGLLEAARVERTNADCLFGTSACAGSETLTLELLGVEQIVIVRLTASGDRARAIVRAPDTERVTVVEASGDSHRATLLNLIRELTGATGTLVVRTTPEDAIVRSGEDVLGRTPLDTILPIGVHPLQIQLDGYYEISTRIEIRAGDRSRVQAELERRSADLHLRSATEGIAFSIDSRPGELFEPGSVVEIEPGSHTLRAAAPGSTPVKRDFEVVAGDFRELRINLRIAPETFVARQRDDILRRPLRLQGTALFGASNSDWSGAAGGSADARREIDCTLDENAACGQRAMLEAGAEFDLIQTWSILQLGLIGVGGGWLRGPSDVDAAIRSDGDEGLDAAYWRDGYRFELRFLQPGLRWLVNDRFEPNLRTGPAWVHHAATFEDRDSDESWTMSRSTLHWQGHIGVRTHLNRLFYATGDVSISTSLASGGPGPRVAVMAGVGFNLPDVFLMQSALAGVNAPDAAPPPLRGARRDSDAPYGQPAADGDTDAEPAPSELQPEGP